MLLLTTFLGLLATVTASQPSVNITSTVIPNSYIIQLKNDSASSLINRGLDAHSLFHKRATDIEYDVDTEFKSPDLFYGLTVTVKGDLTADEAKTKILEIPNVEAVWPNYLVKAMTPQTPYGVSLNSSSATKTARSSPSSVIDEDAPGSASNLPRITGDLDVLSTLKMSQVDKLHALGIKGKGVKIGIIDTGVDYRHPALGGGFGPGFKVEGGYRFIQDDWDGPQEIVEGDDPLVTCLTGGHGTHVSGIVGAEDPEGVGFGVVGVAPEASIYMYRIFSCPGYSTTNIIMRAMQMAIDDGMDVVSMSFGQSWERQETDPFTQMTSGMAARGIAPVVAAGNDGYYGISTPSSPAIGPDVIAVGSIANTKFPVTYKGVDSRGRDFRYASIWPITTSKPLDVYLLTYEGPNTCDYFGYTTAFNSIKNIDSTIIVSVGANCLNGLWRYFDFKYVAQLNDLSTDPFAAEYWLLERTDAENEQFINIDGSDSATILAMYQKAGGYGKYQWSFGDEKAVAVKQSLTGGMMSNFSSFGPPIDTRAPKPQISGPGGNILSTWPLGYLGGYTIISGTSMATPFVAACYALVKSQFPDLSVREIQHLLQSTSVPASYVPDKSILSTVAHQGSGLVNPYAAITYQSTVSPGELDIAGTDTYGDQPRIITIKNKSSRSKTYILSHQGAGLAEEFPYPDILKLPYQRYYYGVPQYAKYGSVTFSTNQVLLGPGQSIDVEVTFSPPTNVDATKGPILSGFIKVSNNNDHFSIPYSGLPYSRFGTDYFDSGNLTGDPYPLTTYSYTKSGYVVADDILHLDWANYENPVVSVNTYHFTRHLRMDVVPANTTFIPDFYGFDKDHVIEYQHPSLGFGDSFLGHDTYGWLSDYADWSPGKIGLAWYSRRMNAPDGSEIQATDGDYRLLMSVLRWGGDPEERGSWQTYLSPVIRYVNTDTDY